LSRLLVGLRVFDVPPAYLDHTHAQNQKDVFVTDKQKPSPVSYTGPHK